jgi:hypothetical protein
MTDLRCSSGGSSRQCYWGDTGTAVALEQLWGRRLAQAREAEVDVALERNSGAAADWRISRVGSDAIIGVLCKGE